ALDGDNVRPLSGRDRGKESRKESGSEQPNGGHGSPGADEDDEERRKQNVSRRRGEGEEKGEGKVSIFRHWIGFRLSRIIFFVRRAFRFSVIKRMKVFSDVPAAIPPP